jgi:hypothetical protein
LLGRLRLTQTGQKRAFRDGRFGATQLMGWAELRKRAFEIDREHCPNTGVALTIIVAILRGEPGHKRS